MWSENTSSSSSSSSSSGRSGSGRNIASGGRGGGLEGARRDGAASLDCIALERVVGGELLYWDVSTYVLLLVGNTNSCCQTQE